MPRKKGWFRAKRKAEEQRAVQAIGNYDHEYCSLPKRSTCDSEPHILDHDYYTKESVDLNDTSELFSVHSHVYRKSENGETDMIYDDTEVAETVDYKILFDCDFILYTKGERFLHYSRTRAVLRDREYRRKEKELRPQKSYLHSKSSHSQMDRNQLLLKLNEQKNVIKDLQKENARLMRQVDKYIRDDGIKMDKERSLEFSDLMSSCESEVMKAFPNSNCFQRLFWEQQMKEAKSGKCGMRWHPMIVRWCLYLRQTSNKCYETLRKSGFLKLPSSRTLFDYSHYIKSVNGFSPEVFQMLKNEATKNGMYKEEWKLWVGLLFDEIHVKADLVYDKHSGELVGYVDLDSVGNQILQMQHQLEQSHQNLAKSMLVLMVRGLCGNLTFPLAGFATDSIKADFLYPIVWKTILYLERFVKLKVLCVTCDGASPNRKFFNLHKGDDDTTYYSINPHDRSRKIFFISNVPHLLKTTRNCISNSFWHKNSRRLWKDGKEAGGI
ncbi:uncharacterized protein LOC132729426 [Ruditapes philippinarum]|uniref:uncharacterized protein LOC132729426 n=1 Tax=Ruditapes philippinarum TaxID=129788 RepID=UPI00295A843F|nr:uncharacterized protein LOC132729426 [Ruditapes philippinarum]